MTTALQALLTGYIIGALRRAADDGTLSIEAHLHVDERGNYLPQLSVIGQRSGERLIIKVEQETKSDDN